MVQSKFIQRALVLAILVGLGVSSASAQSVSGTGTDRSGGEPFVVLPVEKAAELRGSALKGYLNKLKETDPTQAQEILTKVVAAEQDKVNKHDERGGRSIVKRYLLLGEFFQFWGHKHTVTELQVLSD